MPQRDLDVMYGEARESMGVLSYHFDFIHTYFEKMYEMIREMYFYYDEIVQGELRIQEVSDDEVEE